MGLPSLVIVSILYFSLQVQANDIRLGYAGPTSHKIFSEIREANPAIWTRSDEVIINTIGTDVISAIYVTDLRDNKDGEANIVSGGLGAKTATISLKSPAVFRGYKFEIEVYADDPNARYNSKNAYQANYGVKDGYSAPYYDNGQFARKGY